MCQNIENFHKKYPLKLMDKYPLKTEKLFLTQQILITTVSKILTPTKNYPT